METKIEASVLFRRLEVVQSAPKLDNVSIVEHDLKRNETEQRQRDAVKQPDT